MGITYIGSAFGYSDASGTILDCSSTLTVAANDILVGFCAWEASSVSVTSIAQTDAGNPLTVCSISNDGDNYGAMAYKTAASSGSSVTFRLTLSSSVAYRHIAVLQFRPDTGDTVTLDAGPSPGSGNNTHPYTGNISTTGTDEVIVAAVKQFYNIVDSSHKIGGVSADGVIELSNYSYIWYKVFTSPQSNINGDASLVGVCKWIADIIALKSEGESVSYTPCYKYIYI